MPWDEIALVAAMTLVVIICIGCGLALTLIACMVFNRKENKDANNRI